VVVRVCVYACERSSFLRGSFIFFRIFDLATVLRLSPGEFARHAMTLVEMIFLKKHFPCFGRDLLVRGG